MKCPCGLDREFSECCEPYIKGEQWPKTAEELMRSRYSAYTHANIGYIKKTSSLTALKDFDEDAAKDWATQSEWRGLKILSTRNGSASEKKGVVEFEATYVQDGETLRHHETSTFKRNAEGHWMFIDGESHVHKGDKAHQSVVRESPKVGRNDPCPCGSGKKYKKCCGM